MEKRRYSIREKLGAIVYDLPVYSRHLATTGGWVKLKNRRDVLTPAPNGEGAAITGDWSSDLHACNVFPFLGGMVMRRALVQWPLAFSDLSRADETPALTFVIPFRGLNRLGQLRQVVRSILGQSGVAVQCLVVEQNNTSEVTDLPRGADYLHLPHPTHPSEWHKSWAFNVGVKRARADVVVCHDADILVPQDYAREVLRKIGEGFDAVHLQRFLFCLNQTETERLIASGRLEWNLVPERIRQNWQGGTLAITKRAFEHLHGYDESFVGWGGEDNEFYDRCRCVKQWTHGFLPFLHLWHPPQDGKWADQRTANLNMLGEKLATDREARLAELAKRQRLEISVEEVHG